MVLAFAGLGNGVEEEPVCAYMGMCVCACEPVWGVRVRIGTHTRLCSSAGGRCLWNVPEEVSKA